MGLRVPLEGIDIGTFNADAPIDLTIGAFHLTGTPGNDRAFRPGNRRTTLVVRTIFGGRIVTASQARFSWNTKTLSISIVANTSEMYLPVLAGSLCAPGKVNMGVPASLAFGALHDDFAVQMSGSVVVRKAGATEIALRGTGVAVNTSKRVGTGTFQVDVTTGVVVVGDSTPALGATANSFQPAAIFTGSSMIFNSSQLLNEPGDAGRQVLNVSFTNRSGEAIGQLPSGAVTGERVLFSPFMTAGGLSLLSSLVTVSHFASGAVFATPTGVAVGADGSVYVADPGAAALVKITNGAAGLLVPSRSFGAVAVNPVDGAVFAVDIQELQRIAPNGSAAHITFFNQSIAGLAIGANGVIYNIEGNRIVTLTLKAGSDPTAGKNYAMQFLAGGLSAGFKDAVGTLAEFNSPGGITVDRSTGNVYVADTMNNRVRLIFPNGTVSTIGGSATAGSTDGRGDVATFNRPSGVVVAGGAVMVCESAGNKVRQLTLAAGANPAIAGNWQVATLAGTGSAGSADGAGNVATFNSPVSLASDGSRNLYVADFNSHEVRLIVPANGFFPVNATTGAAGPSTATIVGIPPALVELSNADGVIPNQAAGADLPYIEYPGPLANGATTAAQPWAFILPSGVASFNFTASVEANTGTLAPPTAVSNPNAASLASPAIGAGGGSPNVNVRTLAGTFDVSGFFDGSAAQALFGAPQGITVDAAGNVYIADAASYCIRRISAAGVVSTVAGTEAGIGAGTSIDGAGNVAAFHAPSAIAASLDGRTLFVADSGNNEIRRIALTGSDPANPADWTVTTIAGSAGAEAYVDRTTGDKARFSDPAGIALDAAGHLYVTEFDGNRVRSLQYLGGDPSLGANWYVSLVAGDTSMAAGVAGATDASGANAQFNGPTGIAVDLAGSLYVADTGNSRIRKITTPGAETFGGAVITLAGPNGATLTNGYADGTGTAALFSSPIGIAIDSAGYCYVSDLGNVRIRRISPAGTVETVAGTGASETVSGGVTSIQEGGGDVATFSRFGLAGLAVDAGGTVYVCDSFGSTIRIIQRTISVGTP